MILTICPNPSIDKFIYPESFRTGGVNNSLSEKAFPGGKGVHVALAVAELGLDSRLTGFWGGPTGSWIRQCCEEAGVPCSGPEVDGWTRTCLTIIPEDGAGETELRERGPTIENSHLVKLFQDLERQLPAASALCVSGSWPDGTPSGVYRQLQTAAESATIPLWVDAAGRFLEEALRVRPFGIHVNRTEAEEIFGAGSEPGEYARKLLGFCSYAAVTDGANGLFLADEKCLLHARCSVERVISTVGSGDCLLAGLIAAHNSGADLEGMARTATACGAANCIRPELGMIRYDDVVRLEQKTTSNPIG